MIGHSLGSVVAYDTLRTRRWVNIAAPDDVVAARRELHAIFDRDRPHDALFEDTRNVDNGSKPHHINFYLTKKSCGAAVADTLT